MLVFGECLDKICHFSAKSRKHDFAVAFWGRGAARNFGLVETAGAKRSNLGARIICNLRLGGTCPDEIRLLIDAGVAVKHDDRLHAKVYRFDDNAIVGSANASSNGLGFENSEAHWFEASCVVEAPACLRQIDAWFEARWQRAKEVAPEDLEIAKVNYKRNRAKRPVFPSNDTAGFVEILRSQPEVFVDKPIYLICNYEAYAPTVGNYARQRSTKTGLNIDFYEGWCPPAEALLLDFSWYDNPKGKPLFAGLYRSARINKAKIFRGSILYEVEKVECSAGGEAPITITPKLIRSQLKLWQEIIEASRSRFKADWDKTGCCIHLEKIAYYLHGDRNGPVLNVFDNLKMYYVDDEGYGVSGNWARPETAPTRIRVYQAGEGSSVAGGTIRRRKKINGKVVFVFELDDGERGCPWPNRRFRANGCVQTAE